MSTWLGISTALSSLRTQRVAIDVTGQNIANVNTPGYARQRVDLTAGIGVDVSSIQRLYSGVLGSRSRTEEAQLQDFTVTSTALKEIEQVFAEPSAKNPVGFGRLTVRHIAAAPAVDFRANGQVLFGALTNGASATKRVEAANYAITVSLASNEAVVLGPTAVNAVRPFNTIVYAWGSATDGTLALATQRVNAKG